MRNEILSYTEVCLRQHAQLQKGMNFRIPPKHSVVLMSRRPNAPYKDVMSEDESVLIYEGHDDRKTLEVPNPKLVDQPRFLPSGKPTDNGRFADWIDKSKTGATKPAMVRVYEKIRVGIWSDRGLFDLTNYEYIEEGGRRVFRFELNAVPMESSTGEEASPLVSERSRQIPSWVKQEVFKRDKGQCVLCGAKEELHFDHELPYSQGGTSVTPQNVRILCARHNLSKGAKIE